MADGLAQAMAERLAIEGGMPMRSEFLPFGRPLIGEDEIEEVVDTLRSGWLGTGSKAQRFEEEFATFVGAHRAVAVNSCTAALHLSLLAAGCGPGDEVITTDLTFAATANAIVHAGAEPVLADIDQDTLNVTVETIERRIGPRTKALLPVHFGGLPCELEDIYRLAADRGLVVIEDCAHALGAEYRGRPIGAWEGFSCFSFYPNKHITTAEGGMVTLPDAEAADRIAVWRLHGLDRDAWSRFHSREVMLSTCVFAGFKYNMPDLAASVGLPQLRRLPELLSVREEYAKCLDQALEGWSGVRRQKRPYDRSEGRHALHLYVLIVDPRAFRVDRNQIVAALRAENIGAAIHYEPLHRHPYYRERLKLQDEDLPVASAVGSTILSLPLSPSMTSRDVDEVVGATEKVLRRYRR